MLDGDPEMKEEAVIVNAEAGQATSIAEANLEQPKASKLREVPVAGTLVYADVPDVIREHLTCKMCGNILTDPVTIPKRCQHVFCMSCIELAYRSSLGSQETTLPCHVCSASIPLPWTQTKLLDMAEHSCLARDMLKELAVHCRFGLALNSRDQWEAAEGPQFCSAIIRQDEVASHEEKCPRAIMECTINGCSAVFPKTQFQAHMNEYQVEHLQLLMEESMELQRSMASLGAMQEEADRKLATTRSSLVDTQEQMGRLATELKEAKASEKRQNGESPSSPRSGLAHRNGQRPVNAKRLLVLSPNGSPPPTAREDHTANPEGTKPEPKVLEEVAASPSHGTKRREHPQGGAAPHSSDGHRWRKYGEKRVRESVHPRSYYRCSFTGCSAKKTVEVSGSTGEKMERYVGSHNHDPPSAPAGQRGNSAAGATHSLFKPTVETAVPAQ